MGLAGVAYSIVGQAILGEICEYCILLDILILLSVYLLVRHRKSLTWAWSFSSGLSFYNSSDLSSYNLGP